MLNNQGIENIICIVNKNSGGDFFDNAKIVATDTTDINGECRLKYWNTNTVKQHRLQFLSTDTSDNYFLGNVVIDGKDKGNGGSYSLMFNPNADVTLEFAPRTYKGVVTDNVNYFNESDKLRWYWVNIDVKNDDLYAKWNNPIYGTSPGGVSVGGDQGGAGWHQIVWEVTRNGEVETFEDTFYAPPWDTVYYYINY